MAVGTDIITNDGKNILTIVLIAENLLDTGYQNHLSRLKYAPENPATGRGGIFDMGRNFSFKVIVPYSLKK
jgi:iron complex outermembrane receptor protein